MMKPVVSIIIVSYNTKDVTAKAVTDALASQGFSKGEIELIVVDNNSPDGSAAYLHSQFPAIKVIANKSNPGFGGGNNQGAEIAKGKYLLLLNPDAFLEPLSLRVMVDLMETHPEYASVGPQLRYADGSLQQSAGYLPTPLRVLAWMWWLDKLPGVKKLFPEPYHVFDLDWYREDREPGWLMGACVLFRRDEFMSVGGFDDKIFMYAEEVELYRRLHEKLHKKFYLTTATHVTHIQGVSTKKANAYRLSYELKGIEYIYLKHYPGLYWLIKFIIVVGVAMRIIVFSLIPGRRDTLPEYKKYFAQL